MSGKRTKNDFKKNLLKFWCLSQHLESGKGSNKMASTNQDLDSVAIVSAIIGQKKPFVFD